MPELMRKKDYESVPGSINNLISHEGLWFTWGILSYSNDNEVAWAFDSDSKSKVFDEVTIP